MERPVDIAVVAGSVAAVAAGLVWPQAAELLLRLLLASLAVGWVARRAYRSIQPMQSAERRYSPFDGFADAPPSTAPRALRMLASGLRAADRPRTRRATVPAVALRTIRTSAEQRLAERHGLRLSDPDHRARIRSMVSEALWTVIRPDGVDAGPDRRRVAPTSVPLSELGRILDELERL